VVAVRFSSGMFDDPEHSPRLPFRRFFGPNAGVNQRLKEMDVNFIEASEEGDKARRLLPAGWLGVAAVISGSQLLPLLFADVNIC